MLDKEDFLFDTDQILACIDLLNLHIAKAKALAAVATDIDFSEYDMQIASEYWATVMTLLEEAQELCRKTLFLLSSKIAQPEPLI